MKNNDIKSFLRNSYIGSLFESTDILNEFDANGEEETTDDNEDEYNLEDDDNSSEDSTDADNADSGNQEDDQDNSEETTDGSEEGSTEPDENSDGDEYSLDDGEEDTEDQDNEPDTQSEEPSGEEDTEGNTEPDDTDNNEDEYTLDDDSSDDGEEQSTDDSEADGSTEPDENSDGDEYSLDNDNQDGGGDSGEDNNDLGTDDGDGEEQDKLDSIKQIEKDLFENLSPQQKNIKIKTLKKNYMTLHARCNAILDMINDYTPSGEATVKIFDYIQKTVQEVQDNMHDYLTQTFDTKSFIDNQAQFKQYLAILNSVKNILNEFISDPDSNKQS